MMDDINAKYVRADASVTESQKIKKLMVTMM